MAKSFSALFGSGSGAVLGASAATVLVVAGAIGYSVFTTDREDVSETSVVDAPSVSPAPTVPVPENADTADIQTPERSEADTNTGTDAIPEQEPEAAPPPEPPTFDLVRVEADGSALVAGQAAPEATVTLKIDGEVIEVTTADAGGSFVAVLALMPSDDARLLSLEAAVPGGAVMTGEETIIIAAFGARPQTEDLPQTAQVLPQTEDLPQTAQVPPQTEEAPPQTETEILPSQVDDALPQPEIVPPEVTDTAPRQLEVASATPTETDVNAVATPATEPIETEERPDRVTAPDIASAPVLRTQPEPDGAQSQASLDGPAPQAGAAVAQDPVPMPVAEQASSADQPESPPVEAQPSPRPQRPAPPETAALETDAPPAPAPPRVEARVDPVPEIAPIGTNSPPTPLEAAPTPAPRPEAPAVLLADAEGVRVMQAPGDVPTAQTEIRLDAISYNTVGDVSVVGRGPPDTPLRVVLDGQVVQRGLTGASGDWRLGLPNVDPGTYTLTVEQLSAEGRVTRRIETPFLREDPQRIADNPMLVSDGASVITVQPGFTLWGIAQANFGDGLLYVQIFQENQSEIDDPDLIFPGQIFNLPELPRAAE